MFIGQLGRSAREFYKSTLREIHNAIQGFRKLKEEDYEEYMFGVRKVIFYHNRAMLGKKGFKKESDIFPLKVDSHIRRKKISKMKPIKAIRKNGQQSNG